MEFENPKCFQNLAFTLLHKITHPHFIQNQNEKINVNSSCTRILRSNGDILEIGVLMKGAIF